ncbi:hypothetical protein NUW58_g6620 [Xylaria curta]|uniref:Uncharacterized protein n=1 Tax=Xylaria curta TaxID=42375 RepID=A0ACC1NRJ9_9PEZI|nr:hypothetical protein NUW58_g6620 [Xylaria curta]
MVGNPWVVGMVRAGATVAVFTRTGEKTFCTGMDLKRRFDFPNLNNVAHEYPHNGFGGMTNRTGESPIIIACNGHAHGGGMEIALNSDVIFASANANFRPLEALHSVSTLAGALSGGMVLFVDHRMMDLVLAGQTLAPKEAVEWELVKEVPQEKLLERAIDYADEIVGSRLDSVMLVKPKELGSAEPRWGAIYSTHRHTQLIV